MNGDLRDWPWIERTVWKGECLLWTGEVVDGEKPGCLYGVVLVGGRLCFVHRLAYCHAFGTTLGKREVHHACRHTLCVRPIHLIPMSKADHAELHKEQGKLIRCGPPKTAELVVSVPKRPTRGIRSKNKPYVPKKRPYLKKRPAKEPVMGWTPPIMLLNNLGSG